MGRTYLSEIYNYFLSSISDYALLEAMIETPEDVEDDLYTYFKKARIKFYKCKNSLNTLEDNAGQKYFGNEVYYTVKNGDTLSKIAEKNKIDIDILLELNSIDIDYIPKEGSRLIVKIDNTQITGFEISIITHLMLVEYMRPQVLATEVMKQSLSDKDFRIYSQANQLRELNLLYRLMQKESNNMITEYTYMEMTKNDRR